QITAISIPSRRVPCRPTAISSWQARMLQQWPRLLARCFRPPARFSYKPGRSTRQGNIRSRAPPPGSTPRMSSSPTLPPGAATATATASPALPTRSCAPRSATAFRSNGIDNLVNLGSGNDTVLGGQGSNYIVGNGGNDELIGGGGGGPSGAGNTIYAFGGSN